MSPSEVSGVDCNLAQEMEVLNVAVLMNLCYFKVVNLLYHVLELLHYLEFFTIILDPGLGEDALILFGHNL